MSKFGKLFLLSLLIITSGVFFIAFNSNKISSDDISSKTVKITEGNIDKKQLFSGVFEFSQKVDLKPKINGVVYRMHKEIGDTVKIGEIIAEISPIIDPLNFENASKQLKIAQINFKNEKINFERQKELFEKEIIPHKDFETAQKNFDLIKEELKFSKNNLFVTQKGYSSNTSKNNLVISTLNGTILDIPNKLGASVVQRNNFSEGSTICTISNFKDLTFNFYVTENELVKLRTGMNIQVYISALNSKIIQGQISSINYTKTIKNNISKYLVKTTLKDIDVLQKLRGGFTGTAELLERKENILITNEENLFFENDSVYVKLVDKNNSRVKRFIKTGISDGVFIEITEGLSEGDLIINRS